MPRGAFLFGLVLGEYEANLFLILGQLLLQPR